MLHWIYVKVFAHFLWKKMFEIITLGIKANYTSDKKKSGPKFFHWFQANFDRLLFVVCGNTCMSKRLRINPHPGAASLNVWEALKLFLLHLLHLVGESVEHGVVRGEPVLDQLRLLTKPQQAKNCCLWSPPVM